MCECVCVCVCRLYSYFLFSGFVIHLWHRLANGCVLGRAYLSSCPVVCFVYEMMDFRDI